MNNLRKKHKILEKLYNTYYAGENHWYDQSRGLYRENVLSDFGFSVSKEIESLRLNNFINFDNHYVNGKPTYYITPLGQVAFLDGYFLSKVWYYSRDFWMALLAILISVVSLLK